MPTKGKQKAAAQAASDDMIDTLAEVTEPASDPRLKIRLFPVAVAVEALLRLLGGVSAAFTKEDFVAGLVLPDGWAKPFRDAYELLATPDRSYFRGEGDLQVFSGKYRRGYANELLARLAERTRVIAFVEDADYLTRDFRLVADVVLEAAPTAEDAGLAVAWFLGEPATPHEAAFLAGQPPRLLAAVRRGRTLAEALYRIRAAGEDEAPVAAPDDGDGEDRGGPTLDDLHGYGEAAEWGRELVRDLTDWREGRIAWADVDRGILLSGPPGCGKTTFAAALARSCGAHFVSGSAAQWQAAGHMGDMLRAMRRAFDEAKTHAPSILLIDEVDAFGDRERMEDRDRQYCSEVVTGLLQCLDGAEGREGVVVVGAANHPDRLDAAITRAGRLDRHVVVPLPDHEGREGILRYHLRGALSGEDLGHAVRLSAGWSGADLEQVVREARRHARRDRRPMLVGDLLERFPALVPVPEAVRWRTCVHEAGHVAASVAEGRARIVGVLVPRARPDAPGHAMAGGVATGYPRGNGRRRGDWLAGIATWLGGAAAEEEVLGERHDGSGGPAGSDLHQATVMAAAMAASTGLGGSMLWLSPVDSEEAFRRLAHDSDLRSRTEAVLAEAWEAARAVVREHRAGVVRLAEALRDREKLSGEEAVAVLKGRPRLRVAAPARACPWPA